MRVALVVNGFPVLSETFIYNQAAALAAVGLDVTIVTASDHDDAAMFEQFDGLRFTGPIRRAIIGRDLAGTFGRAIASASTGSFGLLEHARRRYGSKRRAVRAALLAQPLIDFDVVHFEYSGLAVAWADALPLLAHAKLFVSCRGTAERITPYTDAGRAEALREVFSIVDRVHCVSADILRGCETLGLDRAKAFVNYPAIDARRFVRDKSHEARTSPPYQLISTGRLHWAKGLEFGLLAVKHVIEKGHQVHYTIVGSGDEEDRLRFAIHDLDLGAHVTLTGRRTSNDVHALLAASDIYLLPSVSEGVSNAALEAMAMSLPVVASAVGGMPEAIRDGVDGLLVPSRDPAAMARRIIEMLVSSERRIALGREARHRVEREFSIERQRDVFVAEYQASRR